MAGSLVADIRIHLPVGLCAGIGQGGVEPFAVKVIVKDRFAAIPAIRHMINRAGIFNPQLPGHDDGLTTGNFYVKAGLTPLRSLW